jgi:hypothetical protein
MSEPTYVECDWCKNWEHKYKSERLCARCQNTRKVRNPQEILCNLCGECMCPLGTHNEQSPNGLYLATVMGGYDSYELLDCHNYTFSLCEKCLRNIFQQAKIKPEIREVSLGMLEQNRPISWEEDNGWYEYKVWKDAGNHHLNYMNKQCNATKDCPNKALYTVWYSDEFSEDALCEEHKDHYKFCVNTKLTGFVQHILKPFL